MSDRKPPEEAHLDPTEVRGPASAEAPRGSVRFTPGSMLAARYRIVALLGRGGMGEVYRAEDVRLGQQVALKFLPTEFAADADKLQRLYAEVRLGRQVSHPNVCRLYDIAEVDGHHFISMEYIDGEDLASLLRRIGKLPHEKALDLARDLCAGLAAAHGLGIVHRDLKPANVMIDGRGDARITDFGLAALAEDLEARREVAGTPAYMAPEQLSGREVSQKTDLYALGLIFYEMFTGKRLFQGDTLGEIISQQGSASSNSISRETQTLDPAVQRVIVRCLEQDPAKRPPSIHSVIAALPGGDPLQAAIDAGETPSPEMVAAAGTSGELRPAVAWPLLLVTLLVILTAATLSPRVRLYGQTELPLEAYELAIRARQILAGVGLERRPADVAREFGVDRDYRSWKGEQAAGASVRENAEAVFSPLFFGYRESAAPMAAADAGRVSAFEADPPLDVGGMGQVILEPDGRLRRLVAVPPEVAGEPAPAPEGWEAKLFEQAGLSWSAARATAPQWRPPVGADARFAWLVPVDGLTAPIRVEAATLAGAPVWFEAFPPWRRPAEAPDPRQFAIGIEDLLTLLLVVASLIVGGILASRNVRRGRGDRRGVWRLATFVAGTALVANALMADHYARPQLQLPVLFDLLAVATFIGVVIAVWYLALEPYLRRRWPRTLIAWARLLQNRWSDPLVGRDVLIGVLAGSLVRLLQFVSLAAPQWLGWAQPIPADSTFLELSGWSYSVSYVLSNVVFAVVLAMTWMIVLLVGHLLLRARSLAVVVVFLFILVGAPIANYPVLEWPMRAIFAGVLTVVMVRYGLVALASTMLALTMFDNFPITLDPSVWYFDRALFALAVLIGLAVYGFIRAVGAQAVFGEPVLEE